MQQPVPVRTPLGVLRLHFSARGLQRLELGRLAAPLPGARSQPLPRHAATVVRQLQCYAAGTAVAWRVRLDLAGGTLFQQRVWRVLRRIPFGTTRSYGWVARQLGQPGAARAVGAACRANPIPIIIPCHRVVAADGALGGFSAGRRWKRRLLQLERAAAGRAVAQ